MIESEGHGATIEKGDRVTVHATGIVKETGKKFWSTKGKLQYRKENAHINQPFFLVGTGGGSVYRHRYWFIARHGQRTV